MDINKVKQALKIIRGILDDKPIIFTFRSIKEGGNKEINKEYYFELNKIISKTKLIDAIDIELFNYEEDIKELIDVAHGSNVAVIISNHDFNKTPPKEEIILRICKAIELGADIAKVAVMPKCNADVITLLDTTNIIKEKYNDIPIITVSMGVRGVISRIAGELFGSCITFASARKASAPGQIAVMDLRKIVEVIHNNIENNLD